VEFTADHVLTKSVYFFDPDGNRLEMFSEMMDPASGRQHMCQGVKLNNRSYTPEPILSVQGDAGLDAVHMPQGGHRPRGRSDTHCRDGEEEEGS
jgi:catechol-2,3-dioxygenase